MDKEALNEAKDSIAFYKMEQRQKIINEIKALDPNQRSTKEIILQWLYILFACALTWYVWENMTSDVLIYLILFFVVVIPVSIVEESKRTNQRINLILKTLDIDLK